MSPLRFDRPLAQPGYTDAIGESAPHHGAGSRFAPTPGAPPRGLSPIEPRLGLNLDPPIRTANPRVISALGANLRPPTPHHPAGGRESTPSLAWQADSFDRLGGSRLKSGFARPVRWIQAQSGQVAVGFLYSIPVVILVVIVALQFVIAGAGMWSSANAARAAARADYVGEDPVAAAKAATVPGLRGRIRLIEPGRDGGTRVRFRPPYAAAIDAPIDAGAGFDPEAYP